MPATPPSEERQSFVDPATAELAQLKVICEIINKQRNSVLPEGDGKSHLVLAYLLLGIKSAGSGFFRFFILRHLALLLQQEPFIHEANWSKSPLFTEAAPLTFAIGDLFMTFFGSQHSVLEFCKHIKPQRTLGDTKVKLISAAKIAWQHPVLSLMVPFALFTAEWKAAIGTQAELNRLAKFSKAPHYLSILFLGIAHFFGIVNAFIYFAFKIDDQATKNLKIRAALCDDPEWSNFYRQHRGFVYRQYAMGMIASLLTTVVVGMTAFYNTHNEFEFSWMRVALFCTLVLPEAVLSLWFTINPDIFYTEIKMLYKKLQTKQAKTEEQPIAITTTVVSAPVSTNTHWILRPLLQMGGFLSAVGTGLSLLPQFIYLSMMMRSHKQLSDQSLSECIPVLIIALASALLLGYRDYVYWAKKTEQRMMERASSFSNGASIDQLSLH